VVPVLFQHSLKESGDDYNESKVGDLSHIFGVEPMKVTSPSTDAEVALALRVLEGCCLLHPESTALAHQNNAIQVTFIALEFFMFSISMAIDIVRSDFSVRGLWFFTSIISSLIKKKGSEFKDGRCDVCLKERHTQSKKRTTKLYRNPLVSCLWMVLC